jgi:serine/threonine protein kinase
MNPETAATPRCPHCQSPIPDGAPAGLCPRCVLTGAATPTDAGSTSGSRATPPSLDEVATAFPDLEILGLIGTGGMGCVYRVRMKSDGREAALKLLPKSLAADPAFMERFNREARTLSRLKHPNIVGVYGYGQSGGFCHLTMEFVDGANLRQAMRAGRFTAAQALEIVPRLCDALQYAHSQGVLHRDIKPENILLDGQGRVKIADFGIAKLVGDGTGHGADITLTQTGARLGTPHYMAPEQIERPDDVDHRADIYSLGVVFYELLTGELPLGRFPAPSAKTYIDARVDEIVFRALAKERELRQQSAAQVGAEVEGLSTPAPKPKVEPFAAVLRRDACFISNPGYLKTLWAQFYIYTGHGQLELTGDRLSFRGGSSSVEIPLRAISGISLGEYPRLTKPTGLNHIAVRFRREAGAKEEVLLFTPFKSAWNATWTTNAVVDEWHRLLVEAWTRLHGRPPAEVPPGEGTAAPSSGSKSPTVSWMTALAAVGAVGVVAAIWLFVVLGRGNEVIKGGLVATMVLGAASGVGLCLWAMGRIRSGRRLGLLFWIPVVFALAFAVYAATLALLTRKSPLPPSFPMPAIQVVATNLGGNVGAAKATEPHDSRLETKAANLTAVEEADPLDAGAVGADLTILSSSRGAEGHRDLWRLVSDRPGTWSVEFRGRSHEFALLPVDGMSPHQADIELRVTRRPDGDGVWLEVATADGLLVHQRFVQGDPENLLREADTIGSGRPLAFSPTWPYSLAELGGDKVRVRRRVLPTGANGTTVIGLALAQKELAERRRKVQAGVLAPQGPEMLEAEYSMVLAEAVVHGDAGLARRARLDYRKRTLGRIEAEVAAGRTPREELEKARLELQSARAAVQALEESTGGNPGPTVPKPQP